MFLVIKLTTLTKLAGIPTKKALKDCPSSSHCSYKLDHVSRISSHIYRPILLINLQVFVMRTSHLLDARVTVSKSSLVFGKPRIPPLAGLLWSLQATSSRLDIMLTLENLQSQPGRCLPGCKGYMCQWCYYCSWLNQ